METKSNLFKCLLYLLFSLTAACPAAAERIIYVDDDAPVSSVEDRNGGANDGSSWENAYTFLQDALVDANDSEKPVEIRVAQGIYKPNQGLFPIIPPSSVIGRGGPSPGVWPADLGIRASFNLINNVTIKGSYAGLWESDPNIRDIELYETILSGDHNGDDIKIEEKLNSPYDLIDEPNRSDNSMHVVTSSNNDANAVIDGFTITGGWDMSTAFGGRTGGAGMRIYSGNPTIKNCTFTCNAACEVGGGIFNNSSNPMLIHCTFTNNYAGDGGGMCNGWVSAFTSSQGSNPTLIDCTFNDNYAYFSGGGIYNQSSNPMLNNCIFNNNSASIWGGGIYNSDSSPILTNCTFSENFADEGAAVFGGSPKMTNCIVWSNTSPQIISNASISFSDIQDSWEGEGNINVNPLFADPNNGDYHLKSQAGRFDPNSGSWIFDNITSPCIDTGDPNTPIGDEPMPNGGIVNMGDYGGTSQASKSEN